jgi:hypothetical protein
MMMFHIILGILILINLFRVYLALSSISNAKKLARELNVTIKHSNLFSALISQDVNIFTLSGSYNGSAFEIINEKSKEEGSVKKIRVETALSGLELEILDMLLVDKAEYLDGMDEDMKTLNDLSCNMKIKIKKKQYLVVTNKTNAFGKLKDTQPFKTMLERIFPMLESMEVDDGKMVFCFAVWKYSNKNVMELLNSLKDIENVLSVLTKG